MSSSIKRVDIFWVDLDPTIGVEIQKTRPKALTEQIRAMEKKRLLAPIGSLSLRFVRLIEQGIRNSLDM